MTTAIAEPKQVKEAKPADRPKYGKKELVADHPTWCPGCGDFSVLSIYFKLMEKLQVPHERIMSVAGIGCSSRFPYFVNAHGVHFLHGRAAAFATGISLTRPDLHVFVFSGDGDAYSIGGNHLEHAARKNVKMTMVVMDNEVYGLTKKQTSPTSPLGFKSKTDPGGAIDQPIRPLKKMLAAGATFIARTHAHLPNHVMEMMEKAMAHEGFSVIECLSECAEFFPGAFDSGNPRKGGVFNTVPAHYDVTDEVAAYKLASEPFPGYFGIFYQVQRPTKNALEAKLIADARQRIRNAAAAEVLQKTLEKFS
jgi:2-oxoglutarate ferredoxin oxidoreductase subunit beta